jgi:hypothetical protein
MQVICCRRSRCCRDMGGFPLESLYTVDATALLVLRTLLILRFELLYLTFSGSGSTADVDPAIVVVAPPSSAMFACGNGLCR